MTIEATVSWTVTQRPSRMTRSNWYLTTMSQCRLGLMAMVQPSQTSTSAVTPAASQRPGRRGWLIRFASGASGPVGPAGAGPTTVASTGVLSSGR